MLRGFIDSTGVEWKVWEVFPSRNAPAQGSAAKLSHSSLKGTQFADGWLCFESFRQKRRLAPIPKGWEYHDGKTLEELCGQAVPVSSARPRRDRGNDRPAHP